MRLYAILPWMAAGGFAIAVLTVLLRGTRPATRHGWIVAALLCVLFLAWSIYAVAAEGPLAFWIEHTHSAWGNQIWFDLLISVGIAWTFLCPAARQRGMHPAPWLVLIACSGSVGLLAMLARYLFLVRKTKADNEG